jgi:hypothetical protein
MYYITARRRYRSGMPRHDSLTLIKTFASPAGSTE